MAVPRARLIERDHGFDALMKRAHDLARTRKSAVKVGVLADNAKGRSMHKGGTLTVAEIAAVLHFGTHDGSIPARPFLAMAFESKRGGLKALGAKLMSDVIMGNRTLRDALNIMGATLVSAAKATIVNVVPPPNAPSTLIARASRKFGAGGVFTFNPSNQQGPATEAESRVIEAANKMNYLQRKIHGIDMKGDVFLKRRARALIEGAKPLIDTGRLLNAIVWALADRGDEE